MPRQKNLVLQLLLLLNTKASLLVPITPLGDSMHSLTSPSVTKCLLKTAVANVQAGHHCCSSNILFDEGAQQSFISQALADQLNIRAQGSVTTAQLLAHYHPPVLNSSPEQGKK